MAEESTNTSLILTQLSELKVTVGIMSDKMTQLLDHETRLRALEKWKYGLPLVALSALTSSALTIYELLHLH